MSFLDKLEKKFGFLAIKNLISYIVLFNALVYVLMYISPANNSISRLTLNPDLVMQGEVWRLITYIFIPPATSPIWIFFILYFYYMVGTGLEQEWGSFKFNAYYLIGMLATTAASFLMGIEATSLYLNLSLFLAFAYIYPDYEILLFFVLPVKVKYLAWLDWALIAHTVVFGFLPLKVVAAASVINYFVFFGKNLITGAKTKKQVSSNRKSFYGELPKDFTIHKCTICGITEKDDPKMDFRYCATCEGDYEYCMNHLKAHEHIKNNNKP